MASRRSNSRQPRAQLTENGAEVQLLSPKTGDIQARNHDLEPAGTIRVDRAVSEASVDEFDALVLPGGTVNPDKLRLDDSAVAFVRDFVNSGKPVAADLPRAVDAGGGRRGRGPHHDLVSEHPHRSQNAGAKVVDEEVVVDGNLITSRSPSGPSGVLREARRPTRAGFGARLSTSPGNPVSRL